VRFRHTYSLGWQQDSSFTTVWFHCCHKWSGSCQQLL
jgi:hypothetical protein